MVDATLAAVAAHIDPAKAQRAVAAALATAGALAEWDSQTIEWVMTDLLTAVPEGVPPPVEQTAEALKFWRAVDNSR